MPYILLLPVIPQTHRSSPVVAYLVNISVSWKKINDIISDLLGKPEDFKGGQELRNGNKNISSFLTRDTFLDLNPNIF